MKNIISSTIYMALLCIVGTANLNAQQVGSFAGTDNAGWFVGNSYNYYAQLRMQTGPNSIFSLSNYGDRFGVFFQNNNYNSDGTFSYSSVTAQTADLFTILKTGNVGIGTIYPNQKLHVNGNARINYNLSVGGPMFDIGDSNGKMGGNFSIMYNGNIGIGDASPNDKLHVNGNVRIETGLSMGSAGFFNIDAPNIVGGRMTVLPSGSVGVGTVNPSGRLHLFEPTGTSVSATNGTLVLEHGNSGGQSSILFKSAVNSGSDAGYIKYSDDGSGNGSSTENSLLEIGVGNDGKGLNQDDIALMPSGFVGVGTRTPTSMLSVNGTVTALNYALVAFMAADYVFEADYKLKTLAETEAYIKENKHLPAFKSAKHYEANGYTITEMNIALEQTVEEMTLHAIAQEKKIDKLTADIEAIKELLRSKK